LALTQRDVVEIAFLQSETKLSAQFFDILQKKSLESYRLIFDR